MKRTITLFWFLFAVSFLLINTTSILRNILMPSFNITINKSSNISLTYYQLLQDCKAGLINASFCNGSVNSIEDFYVNNEIKKEEAFLISFIIKKHAYEIVLAAFFVLLYIFFVKYLQREKYALLLIIIPNFFAFLFVRLYNVLTEVIDLFVSFLLMLFIYLFIRLLYKI